MKKHWAEGDYCEHEDLPGVIWEIFEVTQIDTVTMNLWYEPEDYEPPGDFRFLFEILKSGELCAPRALVPPNAMEVIAISASRGG